MFALTLHFYSPAAYKFVREKFDNHLPHKKTIQRWYANSGVSCKSGFCEQSVEILIEKAKKMKANGTELICSLIFDEMAIRKHLQWSNAQKKFNGQISYGFRPEMLEMPIAKNAIVFMVNGINCDVTVPIAYHFINTLTAVEKITLLQQIITEITEIGVRVLNITFDGLSSNFTMCELLGVSFDMDNLKPYFILPGLERKIYVIVDPSHVLKLVRNTLGNNKVLLDDDGSKIEWKFFEALEKLRDKQDFSHVHKITKRHIEYNNLKMIVRLAAETLSNSVANTMQVLMDKSHEQFSESSATIKFIHFINDCFDVMNTKGISNGNKFKNAINAENKVDIFAFFEKLTDYLKKLKLQSGKSLIDSPNRAAFRGLIVNMASLKSIYEECVESKLLDRLPIINRTSSLKCQLHTLQVLLNKKLKRKAASNVVIVIIFFPKMIKYLRSLHQNSMKDHVSQLSIFAIFHINTSKIYNKTLTTHMRMQERIS